MQSGLVAFKKGVTYKSLKNNMLESEVDSYHEMRGAEHLFKQV